MSKPPVQPTMERVNAFSPPEEDTRVSSWRIKTIAALRIAFGLVWAIAAWLKWQPAFIDSFMDKVSGAKDGQAPAVQAWLSFWTNMFSMNPHFFACLEASMETAIAVLLIFGILTNLTCVVGILLSLGIWSVGEGFGGPYKLGNTTDVGTALPYALFFGVLLASAAGHYYSVDQWLTPRLGRFEFLASGTIWHRRRRRQMAT